MILYSVPYGTVGQAQSARFRSQFQAARERVAAPAHARLAHGHGLLSHALFSLFTAKAGPQRGVLNCVLADIPFTVRNESASPSCLALVSPTHEPQLDRWLEPCLTSHLVHTVGDDADGLMLALRSRWVWCVQTR